MPERSDATLQSFVRDPVKDFVEDPRRLATMSPSLVVPPFEVDVIAVDEASGPPPIEDAGFGGTPTFATASFPPPPGVEWTVEVAGESWPIRPEREYLVNLARILFQLAGEQGVAVLTREIREQLVRRRQELQYGASPTTSWMLSQAEQAAPYLNAIEGWLKQARRRGRSLVETMALARLTAYLDAAEEQALAEFEAYDVRPRYDANRKHRLDRLSGGYSPPPPVADVSINEDLPAVKELRTALAELREYRVGLDAIQGASEGAALFDRLLNAVGAGQLLLGRRLGDVLADPTYSLSRQQRADAASRAREALAGYLALRADRAAKHPVLHRLSDFDGQKSPRDLAAAIRNALQATIDATDDLREVADRKIFSGDPLIELDDPIILWRSVWDFPGVVSAASAALCEKDGHTVAFVAAMEVLKRKAVVDKVVNIAVIAAQLTLPFAATPLVAALINAAISLSQDSRARILSRSALDPLLALGAEPPSSTQLLLGIAADMTPSLKVGLALTLASFLVPE